MNTEQEREAFKKHYGALFDLTETPDAWGNPRFAHESVEAIWYGWRDRAALQSQHDEETKHLRDALWIAERKIEARQSQDAVDAQQVLDALDSGEWRLNRNLPLDYLTDAANVQQAWMVERQTAPFCDSEGVRVWVGPTAIKALRRGQKAIDHARRIEGES